jgi:hypothetical protein
MTTTDITLLQPDPQSIVVSLHPSHAHGDCVSVQFDDPKHGRQIVAFAPEVADYLATLFATATRSAYIGAKADQVRAEQRES